MTDVRNVPLVVADGDAADPLAPVAGAGITCLVATDGSAASLRAVEEARRLLNPYTHVVLVTVIHEREDPMAAAGGFESAGMSDADADAMYAADADRGAEALDRARAAYGTGAEVRMLASYDRPAEVLVEHAKEVGADLIVVGAHHHSLLGRIFQGSTTDGVVHHAPCPVLVVPDIDD